MPCWVEWSKRPFSDSVSPINSCPPSKFKLTYDACNAPAIFCAWHWLWKRESHSLNINFQLIHAIFELSYHMVQHPVPFIVAPNCYSSYKWRRCQWLLIQKLINFHCCDCIIALLVSSCNIDLHQLISILWQTKVKNVGFACLTTFCHFFLFWQECCPSFGPAVHI